VEVVLTGNHVLHAWQLHARLADMHGTCTHPLCRMPGASIVRMNLQHMTGQARMPDSQEVLSTKRARGLWFYSQDCRLAAMYLNVSL
jgi:hypothetical protein